VGRGVSEIEIDVQVDTLFRRNREWQQFSYAHLALAQISEVDAEALMKTSISYH